MLAIQKNQKNMKNASTEERAVWKACAFVVSVLLVAVRWSWYLRTFSARFSRSKMQGPCERNGIVFWVCVFEANSIVISSKLEWVTFSTLESYAGEDLRKAYCYTSVILPALEALSHVAPGGYWLEFPVMVSLMLHLNLFNFHFGSFLFLIF